MLYFFQELKSRNEAMYYFGFVCLLAAIFFAVMTQFSTLKVYGINAYIKPFKFALSTVLLVWAMAWYMGYLKNFDATIFNYTIIVTLGFEIIYIAIQAAKGELSHYNLSSPMYALLYTLMASAASIATLAVAYVGIKFFGDEVVTLPDYYLWAIRLGIFIFVIFSFEGFVMGSRLSHTIGGADGGAGLPLLNWSTKFGDPRVAHFIGMHALQVLPLLAYYLFKDVKITILAAVLYGFLAIFTLVQALQGKPFLK
jgi:hypothetical protein